MKKMLPFIIGFIAYLALPYIFSFLYVLAYELFPNIFVGPFKLVDENLVFISILLQTISELLIIAFFLIKFCKKDKIKEEFNKFRSLSTLKQALITLGIMYLVSFSIAILIPSMSESANQEAVTEVITNFPFIAFFSVVIIAPIVEEIIFRFLLMKPFKPEKKNVAIVLSAILFGALHMISSIVDNSLLADLPNLISYCGIGAVLAYRYAKTENIYVPIQAHFFNNLIAFVASMIL